MCFCCIWHSSNGSFTTIKKKIKNSAAQARPREARFLLASATTLQREATVPHSSLEHLVSNTCVSDSLNLSQKTKTVPFKKRRGHLFAIGTPQNARPQFKTATCRSKKIRDTTSQASMELTSLVSMLAFFERQSCTVATSPLLAAGTRSAVAFS